MRKQQRREIRQQEAAKRSATPARVTDASGIRQRVRSGHTTLKDAFEELEHWGPSPGKTRTIAWLKKSKPFKALKGES